MQKVHISNDNVHYALIGGGADTREDSSTEERAIRCRSRLPDTCADINQSADQKSISSSENLIAWHNDEICVTKSDRGYSSLECAVNVSFTII